MFAMSQKCKTIYLLFVELMWYLSQFVDGACKSAAVDKCRNAVEKNELGTFQQGGVCKANSFSVFTHVCQVTHYDPGVERYCCCSTSQQALCCTYHRDNNEFRCNEAEDSIRVESSNTKILIGVVVSAGVVLIIVACCCSCWCKAKSRKKEEALRKTESGVLYSTVQQSPALAEGQTCRTCQHRTVTQRGPFALSSCSCTCCVSRQPIKKLEPSAPPLEDEEHSFLHNQQVPYVVSSSSSTVAAAAAQSFNNVPDIVHTVYTSPTPLLPTDDQPPPPYEEIVPLPPAYEEHIQHFIGV